jgi:RNA polymerase sigma-70 factor, ECF subfamily
MQDALSVLVLHSETPSRRPMSDSSAIAGPQTYAVDVDPGAPRSGAASRDTTDERLMLEFTLGSSEAFNELFRRYQKPVYGFFRRRVTDPAHAEELSQETWVAVLRAASRYQPRALFRTYLYAVAFKTLRAHHRKANFHAFFLGRPNEPIPDPAKSDPTESGLWVRRAVAKLEPLDREILLLREFEQLTYAEIADLLRLPLNTVRSRLFRARIALRDLLEPPAAVAEGAAEPTSAQDSGPAAPFIAQKRNPA